MHVFVSLMRSPTPLPIIAASTAFFLVIYLSFAVSVWLIARRINRPIELRPLGARQIHTEFLNSLRSILLFGLGTSVAWVAYQAEWIRIRTDAGVIQTLLEMLLLVLWNDLYFYSIHRFLHGKLKKAHVTHHRSAAHSRYHDNFGFFFSHLDAWLGTSRPHKS